MKYNLQDIPEGTIIGSQAQISTIKTTHEGPHENIKEL